MTDEDCSKAVADLPRRATIRTSHCTPAMAERVAASLAPDNTDEMDVTTDGDEITAVIDRPTTGGLHSTVDDYVVNLHVAVQCTNDPTHDINT